MSTWDESKHPRVPAGSGDPSGQWISVRPGGPMVSRDEAKLLMQSLKEEAAPLAKKGYLTREEADRFRELMFERDWIGYELLPRVGNPDKVLPLAERLSTLSPKSNAAIVTDARRSKPIYMAISEAANGTFRDSDTPIDTILRGRDPKTSEKAFYDNFAGTRAALREQYGDTVTLYRAVGLQKQKMYTNWATDQRFARKYGDNVVTRRTYVDDVIGGMATGNGSYHELFVRETGMSVAPKLKRGGPTIKPKLKAVTAG